ncbi:MULTISPECIES: malate synthase [Rheinheimera]|uniref:malate synthase n=1 Tax=Rheinheimera TaxID=67575 RepID=UPI00104AE10A|nr:malate synthase [Rheinheimera sp. D18]QBL08504.1 malate synthase [Rheinheimera sp. D18]
MTTLAQHYSTTTPNQTAWMATELSVINELNQRHVRQVMDYSKGFLDKTFPLQQGSHKEVCSYVVYYQQLLAFFADGSTSGLENPAQFVALSGHREAPSSIVLKNNGRHIELVLNRSGTTGCQDQACIDDIQLQTAAPDNIWFSMVTGRQVNSIHKGDKRFTCKGGLSYSLS